MANHANVVVVPTKIAGDNDYDGPDAAVLPRILVIQPQHIDEEESQPEQIAVF